MLGCLGKRIGSTTNNVAEALGLAGSIKLVTHVLMTLAELSAEAAHLERT